MQRFFIVLLCLGFVRATLQNFTVDDTSPDIHYNGTTFQCNLNTIICPPEIVQGLFNNSATLTNGSITFSFTGTAFYATLELIGSCSVSVDGDEITTLSHPDILAEHQNISKSDMANGPHTLIIAPTTSLTVIGFDHLIYTASLPTTGKSHVGAIVGGSHWRGRSDDRGIVPGVIRPAAQAYHAAQPAQKCGPTRDYCSSS
ncbi:hypothetical protein MVEN_01431800 [Mycena venus]|uniref:Uncharacterized protein n=1 Tax=Mycena venus TaxID=2733690 RepID=A0A8H6XXR7_9AGAR|nr:hypothetical protein MVEN_01431800 [Mycena venus]